MEQYDIIIIGGGGGTKFVTPSVETGLRVAIIEKEDLGGTCLNRGCIPSKMLIHPANVLEAARDMAKYSISGGEDFDVDFKSLVEHVSKTVDADSEGIAKSYTKSEVIDYFHGHAKFTDDHTIEIDTGGETKQISSQVIIIATGSRPLVPSDEQIPGLAGTPYMTSREALRNTTLPKRLLVIGGGYIGCELGHVYQTFGSETVFYVRSTYLQREDSQIQSIFQGEFEKKHTTHYGKLKLEVSYEDDQFTITSTDSEGVVTVEKGDALLVATGVVPNTDDLGLENTSIKRDKKGYITADEFLQTTAEGVFAIGDCVGNYHFRHSVNFEAEYLVENLFHRSARGQEFVPIKYPPMPHAVFTLPEIAGVGKTQEELEAEGADFISVSHEYKKSAQGMARLPEYGLVKLLFDKQSHKLLGAHIIGEESATMIHQLIYAMTLEATCEDLLTMIYIHPALPEIVRNAARTAKKELA